MAPQRGAAAASPGASAAVAARVLGLALLALVGWWVHARLGGTAARPERAPHGAVSTARLFNWHPVLMVLAFPVLMGEALLAYAAPWTGPGTARCAAGSLRWGQGGSCPAGPLKLLP